MAEDVEKEETAPAPKDRARSFEGNGRKIAAIGAGAAIGSAAIAAALLFYRSSKSD